MEIICKKFKDQLSKRDGKYGGTAMHWARNRQVCTVQKQTGMYCTESDRYWNVLGLNQTGRGIREQQRQGQKGIKKDGGITWMGNSLI